MSPSVTESAAVPPSSRSLLAIVPVDAYPQPSTYTRFSRDGRFLLNGQYLYDRGTCTPRAVLPESAIQALVDGADWLAPAACPNDAVCADAIRDEQGAFTNPYTQCSSMFVDPVASLALLSCESQGPEYSSTSSRWHPVGPGPAGKAPCVVDPERSDVQTRLGVNLQWSPRGDAFAFLEEHESWNYAQRIVHMVDLVEGTHEATPEPQDENARGLRAPMPYEWPRDATSEVPHLSHFKVEFNERTQDVFLVREDGVRQGLLDEHMWPTDEEKNGDWSKVTRESRFRTDRRPFLGEMLTYDEIERVFRRPGAFKQFIHGDPMSPRPRPEVGAPPELLITTTKTHVHVEATDGGSGLEELALTTWSSAPKVLKAVHGAARRLSLDVDFQQPAFVRACASASGTCRVRAIVSR